MGEDWVHFDGTNWPDPLVLVWVWYAEEGRGPGVDCMLPDDAGYRWLSGAEVTWWSKIVIPPGVQLADEKACV